MAFGPELRPASHVLEQESRDRFGMLVPPEWVKYALSPDYCFDYDLWPFKNKLPLGHYIKVQVKAESTPRLVDDSIMVRLETTTLEVYARTYLPVVLVVWSVPDEAFYWVDVKDFLETHTRARGMSWRTQASLSVPVPRRQRIAGREDVAAWVSLMNVTGPTDLARAEAEGTRNIWAAALRCAISGNLTSLESETSNRLPNAAKVSVSEALLGAGPSVFRRAGLGYEVADPTVEGLLLLLELGGALAVEFLLRFGWLDRLPVEETGKLIARAVNVGSLLPHQLSRMFDAAPSTYVYAIQFLLGFAPELAREVPGVRIESRPWSPQEGAPPTAMFYELRFENSQVNEFMAKEARQEGRRLLELVRVGDMAYMVLMEALEWGPLEHYGLGFISGRGPHNEHNLTYRQGAMATKVRVVKVVARIGDKSTPYGIVYYAGQTEGFPTIVVDGGRLQMAGGQEGLARVSPDGRVVQWLFEDFIVLEQHQMTPPTAIPTSLPGRRRTPVLTSPNDRRPVAVGFFLPAPSDSVLPQVLASVRGRYREVLSS